jgi:hypothetical protein
MFIFMEQLQKLVDYAAIRKVDIYRLEQKMP